MSLPIFLWEGIIARATTVLPRLPISIGISLRNPTHGQQQQVEEKEIDPRLIELSEQISNSPPPFFIDNGILRAVPKKKVSHQKKRQKWLAPAKKQLKFLHHLNRCPTCGSYKRSHHVCMTCFTQIRNYWKSQSKKEEPYEEEFANERDEEIVYPGKFERPEERTLRKKEYLVNRHKTLPVEKKEE